MKTNGAFSLRRYSTTTARILQVFVVVVLLLLWGFFFLAVRAIVIYSPLGLQNLNSDSCSQTMPSGNGLLKCYC